ncbi:Cna protein B-type domain [Fragilaria crotonensis]|nr:Cna protein B-type domain [Fragilaria crotonensis]
MRASAVSPSIGASPVLKDLSIVLNDGNDCNNKAVGDVCNSNTAQVGCCSSKQECVPLGRGAQCLCINDQPLVGNQDTGCESKLPNCDANDGKTGVSCFLCVNNKALGTKDDGCGDPAKPNCNATDGGKGTECVPACKFSISKSFSGPNIGVEILVAPADGGGVLFKVREADANLLGDLRGVFFHVKDLSKKASVVGNHVNSYTWGPSNSIVDLGNGANMQGDGGKHKYDVGVEIGNSGIGKDDIGETTFTIKGGNFGFADIDFSQEFGVRLTSVGSKSRDQSSKVVGYYGCANAAVDRDIFDHGSLRRLTG